MPDVSRRGVLAGGVAVLATSPARGQPVPVRASYPLLTEPPASHVVSLSDVATEGGTYRLFRAMPRAAPPADGWRSLWMLDGNAAFNRLATDELEAVPGLAVFGVGYPVETEFDFDGRARDYTPEGAGARADPRQPGRETGGDRRFRARLLGPLRAAAEAGGAVDPGGRCLWGHSYGGLFTLVTLLEAPGAFRRYVAVSPSLWFAPEVLAGLEAAALVAPAGTGVVLLHGRDEGQGPEAVALAGRLAARGDVEVAVEALPGLGHGTALAGSFGRALRFAACQAGRAG
jgi:predicted alpha/beta superfamily hydrolase